MYGRRPQPTSAYPSITSSRVESDGTAWAPAAPVYVRSAVPISTSVATPAQIASCTVAWARAAMTAMAPLATALGSPCPDCAILKLCAPPLASTAPVNHGAGRGSTVVASMVAAARPGRAREPFAFAYPDGERAV